MTQRYIELMHGNEPVHTWPVLGLAGLPGAKLSLCETWDRWPACQHRRADPCGAGQLERGDMSDTKPASSQPPMLTVALDLPSAQVLADQASIVSDLRYAVECCKSLLGELDKPEEERDPVVPQALWSAALASYSRCFSKGKRFGLGPDDITSLPLEGEVMTFHKWAIEQRTKLTTHPADPFDAAKVGAALARPGQGKRRVEGIAILTPSRVLVDDTGVRQLGALASALAKQTAERAEEQQDTVLEEAQQLDLDHLYRQPPCCRVSATGTWCGTDERAHRYRGHAFWGRQTWQL